MTKCFTIGCTQHAVDNTLWCAEHGPKPATGSTLYLMERDQWKERALAAESKLQESEKAGDLLHKKFVELDAFRADLQSRLEEYRLHSMTQLAGGWKCEICKGMWAHSRGAELHEDWCPNKSGVVEIPATNSTAHVHDFKPSKLVSNENVCLCGQYYVVSE